MSLKGAPSRLLVVRPDRIGDVIISSSCLPILRQYLPATEIFFSARPVMELLFKQHAFAHFVSLPDPQFSFFRRVQLLRQVFERYQFDCIVSLHYDAAVYLAAFLTKIPRRIGYPLRGLSWTLTDLIPERRHLCLSHEAVSNFDLFQPLGIPVPTFEVLRASTELPLEAYISLKKKLDFQRLNKPYFCFHLGAFSSVARWPVAHFVALAKRLYEERNIQIVLIGEVGEAAAHKEFRSLARDLPYLDFGCQLNLAEVGFLLKAATGLIVRDTGPSHLAAAVGCPVVVVFGRLKPPFGPTRWRPLANANQVRVVCTPSVQQPGEGRDAFYQRAFREIAVEKVVAAINQIVVV